MNLKLNELITSGRALMVEVCPKAGQVARASIAGALLSSSLAAGIIPPSAQASQNYQFRDGISGEIKYAEFCNVANSLRLRVVGEATSRSSRVNSLELKVYSRYGYGVTLYGQTFGYVTGENWRSEGGTRFNNPWPLRDKRFYEIILAGPLVSIVDSPVKFAIHVNHSKGKTIDLGGIVDLGKIEQGKCRIYDDGNFR